MPVPSLRFLLCLASLAPVLLSPASSTLRAPVVAELPRCKQEAEWCEPRVRASRALQYRRKIRRGLLDLMVLAAWTPRVRKQAVAGRSCPLGAHGWQSKSTRRGLWWAPLESIRASPIRLPSNHPAELFGECSLLPARCNPPSPGFLTSPATLKGSIPC